MLDADPGHRPIVLVMLATLSLNRATPTSVGNIRNVPPPAIELIAAARKATRVTTKRDMCEVSPSTPPVSRSISGQSLGAVGAVSKGNAARGQGTPPPHACGLHLASEAVLRVAS